VARPDNWAAPPCRAVPASGPLYAEAFYSPGDYRHQGLDPQRITQAIRKGLCEVSDVDVALITDLIRDHGPERGHLILSAIHEIRDEFGVIGIGIGGSEYLCPPEPLALVYDRALLSPGSRASGARQGCAGRQGR
jgi:hypothetical protein